ncbi:MAG: hypothetical protein RL660_1276 [Bacteroidota bacterium]|jgi:hypothetical protein
MSARLFFLIVLFASTPTICLAQSIVQQVRGTVNDKFTNKPIPNASVIVTGNNSDSTTTNDQGEFLMQLPLGRYTLRVEHPRYEPALLSNVIVNSGKQIVLTIPIEEKTERKSLEGISVTKKSPTTTINEMSISSARQFVASDASRYAGSLGDPARMAQNFAGVVSNGDSRNDIIIRGNSPLGVGWRMEGIEIPNPNHFSGIGTTGGAISIVNNNNLASSDFLTGAFAPQYGNALAGFFDLRMRNGNNQQHEYMAQFGLNGAEFGAEGPLKKGSKSSYMINARYSTLELFDLLGVKLGAQGAAKYRDLTYKLNFPKTAIGSVSIWGLGGYNRATSLSKDYDTTGERLNPRPKGFDTYFDNAMYAVGISQQKQIGAKYVLSNVVSLSRSGTQTFIDSLYDNESKKFTWLDRNFSDTRLSTHSKLGYKWSPRNQTQIGLYYTRMFIKVADSIYLTSYNRYISILKYDGGINLWRGYVQHQYKPTSKISIVGGVHAMMLALNNSIAIEPRAAAKYQMTKAVALNIGTGVHNQMQPSTTYFYNRTGVGSFVDSLTNLNLDFTKSVHALCGVDILPAKNYRIKLDAYVQQISNAAIENKSTNYSTLNEGAFYYIIPKPYLVNNGAGFNRGLELTVEKFFSQHYYFLVTSSYYKSTYNGGDNIVQSTAFDGRWSFVALGGYEFVIGNNILGINLKFAGLGGRPFIPVDTAASIARGETVFSSTLGYTERYPNYFRPDLRISYRLNRANISHEFGINIDNVINYRNVSTIEYDNYQKQFGYTYQMGRLPVLQYKAEWSRKRKS